MNPKLRYFPSLTMKRAGNQLHTSNSKCQTVTAMQGNAESVLVESNFRTTSVSLGDQSFRQTFFTIITLFDDTNWKSFQTFRPRFYILQLVDGLSFSRLACFAFKFFIYSTKFTNGVHVM